jgi:type II secretory pathway predicted ATPase ExeA
MYERFYGLDARPFDLTPDLRYLFLTPGHSEALAHLEYGLSGRKGITVLTGEVGTGKTTLLRAALEHMKGTAVRYAHVSNPTFTRSEFYEFLAAEFRLSAAAAESKAQFLIELTALVKRHHADGGVTAIVIDEAQSLPIELLEEIRLLANLETGEVKLMQVVLVGQPELAERLNEPQLRQLKQRIALRCSLEPMSLQETAAYIAGRIRIAGGDAPRLFTREAVAEVHIHARGIPRLVSVICDNALVTGFAGGLRRIDRAIVLGVCRDFDFQSPVVPATTAGETGTSNGATDPERTLSTDVDDKPLHQNRIEAAGPRRFSLFSSLRSGSR